MWIFISILFLVGTLHFIVNLSMVPKRWLLMVIILGIAAANFALYPVSMSINAGWFTNYLNDYNLLSLACTLQVMESFIVLLSCGAFLKSRIQGTKLPFWGYLSLLPSPIFFGGLFMIQTAALYFVDGMSFGRTSLILAGVLIVLLGTSGLLTRRFTSSTVHRLEIKVYLSLMQLLLAMFLPMTITGGTIPTSQFKADVVQTVSQWGIMILVCLSGVYLTRWIKTVKTNGWRALWAQ